MLREIILNLIYFFSPRNYQIDNIEYFEDGTKKIDYYFGSKLYTHLGDTFPPVFTTRKFPIRKALCDTGQDVTRIISRYLGPMNSFEPCTSYIFHERKYKFGVCFKNFGISFFIKPILVRGSPKNIHIINIFNQQSVLGAKNQVTE